MARETYDREQMLAELPWIADDQPHVVVIIGIEKTKRFTNVIGPLPDKRRAKNYAAKSRREIKKHLAQDFTVDHDWTVHVRPLIPAGPEEDR